MKDFRAAENFFVPRHWPALGSHFKPPGRASIKSVLVFTKSSGFDTLW